MATTINYMALLPSPHLMKKASRSHLDAVKVAACSEGGSSGGSNAANESLTKQVESEPKIREIL